MLVQKGFEHKLELPDQRSFEASLIFRKALLFQNRHIYYIHKIPRLQAKHSLFYDLYNYPLLLCLRLRFSMSLSC